MKQELHFSSDGGGLDTFNLPEDIREPFVPMGSRQGVHRFDVVREQSLPLEGIDLELGRLSRRRTWTDHKSVMEPSVTADEVADLLVVLQLAQLLGKALDFGGESLEVHGPFRVEAVDSVKG